MASNVVVNLLLFAALNQLFSMIKAQQLIILMVFFSVRFPANAALFYNFLIQIAFFDLITIDGVYDYFWPVTQSEALNDNFRQLGFDSMLFQYNLGSCILAFAALPVQLFIYALLKPLRKKFPLVRK